MSMEREVTISIGAELTGVRGADTLNRQIQTLEQSTSTGLARMQSAASRMTSVGNQTAGSWARSEESFQRMQTRAGQWAGSIERAWGSLSSRMQSFQGGLSSTASGIESLLKSWTIFTGSEEDLSKMIKKLLVINAVFDSIRGSAALFAGVKKLGVTFAGVGASPAASSGAGSLVRQVAGSAAGYGVGRAGEAGIRWIRPTAAAAPGGVGSSQLVGWGSGMSGGAATSAGGGAGSMSVSPLISHPLGAIAIALGALTQYLTIPVLAESAAGGRLGSRATNFYGGQALSGGWDPWMSMITSPYRMLTGQRDMTLNSNSYSDVTSAEARQRFSRRMQGETGISLFEVQSLEDNEYQVRNRTRQAMQSVEDRYEQMRTLPEQMRVEGRQRLQQMRLADANRNASYLMGRTTRSDSTEQSFRDSWNANAMASQMALRDKTPSPERVSNELNIARVQNELANLNRRSAGLQSNGQGSSPFSGARGERSWSDWANETIPFAGSMGNLDELGQRIHGLNPASRFFPVANWGQQSANPGNRWMRHVENAQRAMNAPSPRDTTNGNNPLQEQLEIDRERVRLQEQLGTLQEQRVKLTAREREQQAQTLAQERQRFQQVQEFHRNQAQSLRDQQRASASSFGFMPIDEQQRALRIAQAISRGQGNLLSPEDVSFGRGQGILTDFMSAEGERRAGNTGIAGQIEALAAPGGMSRNDRIAAHERMQGQAGAIVNQIQVELSQNLQLQPDALARDIEAVLRPAMQSFRRVIDETIRQELKLDRARQMAQDFTQREKSGAGQRAAAGTP